MKLLKATAKKLDFHLGKREAALLKLVLSLYPRVPPAHYSVTKAESAADLEASRRLLDEALAEQRAANRTQLEALLKNSRRLRAVETGVRVSLAPGEVEWLMQILNDIRVGSWVNLGSPEEEMPDLNETTAPDLWAMEVAGLFQMQFLDALETPPGDG